MDELHFIFELLPLRETFFHIQEGNDGVPAMTHFHNWIAALVKE